MVVSNNKRLLQKIVKNFAGVLFLYKKIERKNYMNKLQEILSNLPVSDCGYLIDLLSKEDLNAGLKSFEFDEGTRAIIEETKSFWFVRFIADTLMSESWNDKPVTNLDWTLQGKPNSDMHQIICKTNGEVIYSKTGYDSYSFVWDRPNYPVDYSLHVGENREIVAKEGFYQNYS